MRVLRGIWIGLAVVVVYLGLSMLGWGLSDWQGFFSEPTRLVYAVIVFFFALATGIQGYHSLQGLKDSKDEIGKRIRRQSIIGSVLVLILFAGLIILPFTSRRGMAIFSAPPALGWVGVILSVLGYLLIFWSGLALGRQYSIEVTIQKDHLLITTGLYRFIRHPRYAGILYLTIGITLIYHTWIGIALLPIVLGFILFRIHDEESLLQSEFGQKWEEYRQNSWRLIPYIY